MNYLEKISSFDENSLLSLDEIVMGSLELFSSNSTPKFDIKEFKKPLIVGSGNAIETAKIIFSGTLAVFCDSTNFDNFIKKDLGVSGRHFDGLVIASASGEKHALYFAKKAKELGIKTKLITCNPNSSAGKVLGNENTIITLKNREPYTYNTSTYMGWILAYTGEKAINIKEFIKNKIDPLLDEINFSNYDSYLLVTPDKFSLINQLFIVKFIELFGRKMARDVFSYEQVKHAITLIHHDTELCISFGNGDINYNGNHIHFPLPKNVDLGCMMAIGYYTIGKIQNSYPQYFKQNIGNYINNINKTSFGKGAKVIVL